MFQKAVKHAARLRLAIAGVSGSGKTYTALTVASELAQAGKRVALVDTERGSASKYADIFDFDVMEMEPPFHPKRFSQAIAEAQKAGYDVIILDSLSHAWNGTGGLLEIVDDIAARSNSKNTFAAWKQGTPIYNALVDSIIQSDIHVIATMRSKQDYVIETDERGKQVPKKIGMNPIQRDGFEYEFDIVLSMDNENTAIVTKTRCPELNGGVFRKPNKDISDIIKTWLVGAPAPEREQSKPISEQPSQSRPLSPEALRAMLQRKAETMAATNANGNEAQVVAMNLAKALGGDEDKRHAVVYYLTGRESLKNVDTKMLLALKAWLGATKVGDDWIMNADAVTEANAVYEAALIAQGQQKLDFGEAAPRSLEQNLAELGFD